MIFRTILEWTQLFESISSKCSLPRDTNSSGIHIPKVYFTESGIKQFFSYTITFILLISRSGECLDFDPIITSVCERKKTQECIPDRYSPTAGEEIIPFPWFSRLEIPFLLMMMTQCANKRGVVSK